MGLRREEKTAAPALAAAGREIHRAPSRKKTRRAGQSKNLQPPRRTEEEGRKNLRLKAEENPQEENGISNRQDYPTFIPPLTLGWLPVAALPKKLFPKVKHKQKRAITAAEHALILTREGNPERRDYYDLCWHLGGSQTDVATLHAEDIDYQARSYCYGRHKTGSLGGTRLGPKAWELILRRPRTGPLFPYLNTVREADRATEFHQRCVGLGIAGVSLHSYWSTTIIPFV